LKFIGKKVCHTKCATLLSSFTTYFDGNFSGWRYFNDILWAQAYNNNTLLLAAIRYKKTMSTAIEG
jgi:hypothetical protein